MGNVLNKKIRLKISKDSACVNFARNVRMDINPDFPLPFVNKTTGDFERITLENLAAYGKNNHNNSDDKPFRGYLINDRFFLKYIKNGGQLEVEGRLSGTDSITEIDYSLKISSLVYTLTIIIVSFVSLIGLLILLLSNRPLLIMLIILVLTSFFLIPLYRAKRDFKRESIRIDSLIKLIFNET
jgi:hypothetical protein